MYKARKCRLSFILEQKKITQQELADNIGISKTRISDYVHNRRTMNISTLKTVSTALKCSMEELYEWQEIKKE